jgi:HSP20 family protein
MYRIARALPRCEALARRAPALATPARGFWGRPSRFIADDMERAMFNAQAQMMRDMANFFGTRDTYRRVGDRERRREPRDEAARGDVKDAKAGAPAASGNGHSAGAEGSEVAKATKSNERAVSQRQPEDVFDLLGDFDALLGWPSIVSRQASRRGPAFEIEESDTAYTLHASLPGVRKDELKVTISDGPRDAAGHQHKVVTVSGERKESPSEEGGIKRRAWSSFSRSMTLPPDAKVDDLKAKLSDGVLSLHLPRDPQLLEVVKNEKVVSIE